MCRSNLWEKSVNNSQTQIKILIVDDHALVREGLALRLSAQADLKVCGEAATEEEGFQQFQEVNPDLVLLDISLKSGNGIDLLKRIRARKSDARILVISGFQESLYAERALRAGALGYLSKQESNDKVLEAIRAVMAGNRYCSPEISQRLVSHALGTADDKSPIDSLTDRELEVFRLIGQGLATGEIATHLFLSTHTIDSHRENLKRKLNLKTAGELTRTAVEWVLQN